MKKIQTWLAGLLVVQIALAGGLLWNSQRGQSSNQAQPLLSFDTGQVDRAVITGEDKNVTIKKVSGDWQLADNSLPADTQKVIDQLNKLEQIKTGWPVASTKSSHERFEVADDKFQRHIELYQGDKKVAELYLGSSPGFRQVNVRRPGDDNVYSATLSAYEFPVEDQGWLDRSLLAAKDINTIKGADYTLKKADKDWQLLTGDGQTSEQTDKDKADALVKALDDLKVLSLVEDKKEAPEQPTSEITVSSGSNNWTYKFSQRNDSYYVSRSDHDAVFKVSKPTFESIVDVKETQLAGTSQSKDDSSSTGSDTSNSQS